MDKGMETRMARKSKIRFERDFEHEGLLLAKDVVLKDGTAERHER